MPAGVGTLPQTGVFIPEKSNIWRDCCDGMYDWVKEHVMEVRGAVGGARALKAAGAGAGQDKGLQGLLQCCMAAVLPGTR
jgi:hypothetical protein